MVAVPNFPNVGPIGNFSIQDGSSANTGAGLTINADGSTTDGGFLLYSILAELRVMTQMLLVIANSVDDPRQLRADAIADMGTLYVANPTTPVRSS